MIVYDPAQLAGLVHASAGKVVFSREGLDKPYHRWTFKKLCDDSSVSSSAPRTLILASLYLWGLDGNAVIGATEDAAAKTAPASLAAGTCAWQCDVTFNQDTASWLRSLCNIFKHSSDNRPVLATPLIDPDDESTWVKFAYHLPADAQPITDYDLRTQNYRPSDWVFEVSDDGANWSVADSREDLPLTFQNYGRLLYFDGGDRDHPTRKFKLTGYVTAGVTNMPAAVGVQADALATVDFSSVTGGQGINAIVVDAQAGAGTVLNAAPLANGTLSIANLNGKLPSVWQTGLSVADWKDTSNLANWSVTVNGQEKSNLRVDVVNGEIVVRKLGILLLFK